MLLDAKVGSAQVYHDVRTDFGSLLRDALEGISSVAALGPIYQADPGAALLAPFIRSASESGWDIHDEQLLATPVILQKVKELRSSAISTTHDLIDETDGVDWTRAGLVLEIARRRGIHFRGREKLHVNWKLRATVTGRFGADTIRGESGLDGSWNFNPLSLGPKDRPRIVPSDACRNVAVIDFRAMDVCSMTAVVPGLAERYGDHPDPHTRTAELVFNDASLRKRAKESIWTYAYGGVVDPWILDAFHRGLPELAAVIKRLPHGEFPRLIQSTSALAFRAGLSRALPLLVGEHFIPMFTVHDELVLDVSDVGLDRISQVTKALEEGASQRIGRPYKVGVSTGYTYEEAKNS